jgi:pantoate--beta-alanine ligase
MKVIKKIKPIQEIADYCRRTGKTIGFVPTMGYLHEGHVALMLAAKDECDIVVTSIYVNPAQFGPDDDFDKYPRDFLKDYYVCKQCGVDYIFAPSTDEMYPKNYKTYISVNDLSDRLEGRHRPGHFTGVATIVLKLFNLVKPHRAYFGQKDAQQVVIIKKMLTDLNINVDLRICDTIREENGLAKSSRNSYLSDSQKTEAAVLYEVLTEGKRIISEGDFKTAKEIINNLKSLIEAKSPDSSIQYIAVTDNTELKKIRNLKEYEGEVLLSLAVYFGKTRLIDNILFEKTSLVKG